MRTVQGELNKTLKKFLRLDKVKTVGAGRTDAGVHARAQVVHFDVRKSNSVVLIQSSSLTFSILSNNR